MRGRTRLILAAVNLLITVPTLVLWQWQIRSESAAWKQYYQRLQDASARWDAASARRDAHERTRGPVPDPAFNDRARELDNEDLRAGAETVRLGNASPPPRRSNWPYLAAVYLAMLPTWIVTAIVTWREWRKKRRSQAGLCPDCGYDLRASPERCPECGAAPAVAT